MLSLSGEINAYNGKFLVCFDSTQGNVFWLMWLWVQCDM